MNADPPPPLTQAGATVGLGLFTGQSATPGGAPMYRSAVDLAVAAESAGFDAFWVSEHHGMPDSYLPSPLPLLAAVATRTTSITVGTGLAIAPLYHPIRLAEDAAVVDRLSQGRLVLGLGAGYVAREYRAFGADMGRRGRAVEQTVAILRAAWRGEPFEWGNGGASAATVTPTPTRATGVPVWLGGYSSSAVRRAARIGDGYLVGRGDPDILAQVCAVAATETTRVDSFVFGVNVLVLVTSDAEDAAAVRQAFTRQQLAYESIQHGMDTYAGLVPDPGAPDGRGPGPGLALGSADRYFNAVGSVEEVVAALGELLEALRGWPRVHLVLRAVFPETDVERQIRRIEMLGSEILPAVRAAG